MPSEHLAGEDVWNGQGSKTSASITGGAGVDGDLIVYVTAIDVNCGGATHAYAGSCGYRDQFDRPLAGYINFCPTKLSSSDKPNQIITAAHEIGHILAVADNHWALFRKADGQGGYNDDYKFV